MLDEAIQQNAANAMLVQENLVSPEQENLKKIEKTPATTNDGELIKLAEDHVSNQRYIIAAQLLKQVSDPSLLQEKHKEYINMAEVCETVRDDLNSPLAESGYKKQTELHGHRDTVIYYKVSKDASMTIRIETPIEESLVVPLLSVFNESDLYKDWMPSYKVPKLGVHKSEKLKEIARGHQIIQVVLDMPFPFSNRECIQHAFAVDSIDQDRAIILKIDSLEEGVHQGLEIPPVEKKMKRVDIDAGFLIRQCPPDHVALQHSNNKYPDGEKLVLLQLVQSVDAHVGGVPLKLINFFTRTVIGRQWGSLLEVAEDVREGRRPAHLEAIQAKRELYDWVEERVKVMFEQ